MKIWMKRLFKIFVIIFTACIVAMVSFLTYVFGSWKTDLSTAEQYKEIYDKKFEVVKELFACQWGDTFEYSLMTSPYGFQTFGREHEGQNYALQKNNTHGVVLGIIKKGSKFSVIKIIQIEKPISGRSIQVLVKIDDAKFAQYIFDASELLVNRAKLIYSKKESAYFNPLFVKPVDSF